MITKEIAIGMGIGRTLYHKTLRNRDGSAVRAKVNGKCRTWKRRPDDYELPMKHGLRDCFYITPSNCSEWSIDDPTEEIRQQEFRERRKAELRQRFQLIKDTPDYVLRDRCIEDGMSESVINVIFK